MPCRCLLAAALSLAAALNLAAGQTDFVDPATRMYTPPSGGAVNFSVSATLGSHMVLQRAPASAVIWGFAEAGTGVSTEFGGKTVKAAADASSVWRLTLPPTPASSKAYDIVVKASTGESAVLSDVLFGDVYVCGGQSNMQFSIGANENHEQYTQEANNYPEIRLFTVGQGTSSGTPLTDLQTVEQPWAVASNVSVSNKQKFGYFSAVCWFFGKNVYDSQKVPLGLVSNNWGGTRVEKWVPPAVTAECGHNSTGELYNAMIHPYTVGPMALSGFIWYQGEADLGGDPGQPGPNLNYSCTQTAMIREWRQALQAGDAFYGIVQLSTWFPNPPIGGGDLLAELRQQQLASDVLKNFAYGTNADWGLDSNIHPIYKQHVGQRLANAARAIVYGEKVAWRSPTYKAASVAQGNGGVQVTVSLNDVQSEGLTILNQSHNQKVVRTDKCVAFYHGCAGAVVQFDNGMVVNATLSLTPDAQSMVLSAPTPGGASKPVLTAYGWASVPFMSVYRADMAGEDGQLPVLPWNRTL